jgi:hypothetical protein
MAKISAMAMAYQRENISGGVSSISVRQAAKRHGVKAII